jgi:hypothetical protein
MTAPALTTDQNILPVQAYFNVDGSFNTFIGQGQPFIVSATESIGINNINTNATFYLTFTPVTSGQITSLDVFTGLTYNPSTGLLTVKTVSGDLQGTALTASNIKGGSANALVYQTGTDSTSFISNGTTGQYLSANSSGAPTWVTPSFNSVTVTDDITTNSTRYPLFSSVTSGTLSTAYTSSTEYKYNPSTGTLTVPIFSGSGASLTNIPNGALVNSSVTVGTTSIALGSSATTIAGLVSVTSTTFVGALTGNASTATTATTATNATNTAITDNTISSATWYPTIVSTTTGNLPQTTSSTKLTFVPSTGTLTATNFSGLASSATNIAGGSANQIAYQTGSGATSFITAPTTASTYLEWNGSAFVWATVSGGGGTPGGSNTQIQYNNSGSFGGVSALTYNGTTLAMTSGTIDGTTIGATTASTGKFTTLESTGTATLADGSTTYIQVVGDASYPSIKAAGGTNTPLVLQPLGTGALQAQKTDSTATGGNARGANAVDWQTNRSAASAVASGAYSVLGGGIGSLASGAVSGVFAGNGCQATNFNTAVLGGAANIASGINSSVVGGNGNLGTGWYGFVGGGFTNSTTATAAVTTQATSTITSGSTAVTLSGSNANIKVGQYITGTPVASDTYVAAISGTSLTLSKNATSSTNATLSFYTPHGVVVGGGNNQATGSYSFVGGGGDAGTSSNRNVASGDWSFVGGGIANQATGSASFIGGGGGYIFGGSGVAGNTASAGGAFVGAGLGNNASGISASILGSRNTANSNYSTALGIYSTTRAIAGYVAFGANQAPLGGSLGLSQSGLVVLAKQTTDATATVLTSDSNAVGTTNQVILPNNSAYSFRATIIAGVTGGGNTASWVLQGAIKRGASASATSIVSAVTSILLAQDSGASTWTVSATADTTNGGLAITVTGQASTTIRWVCKVETTEMTY